jgi:xylulokinase
MTRRYEAGAVTSGAGPDRLLLGIDLGTSAVKVAVMRPDGTMLGSHSAPYPVSRPEPDRAEQDPDAWWAGIRASVAGALAAAGTATGSGSVARRVAAIGLSGQMHGTVLFDEGGRHLGRAIIWQDQRSGAEAAQITDALGARRLVELVGTPIAPGFQAATLAWLREHDRERWDRIRLVLAPKDAVRLRMTGEVSTDASDASGTGLLDLQAGTWAAPLLDALGVPAAWLPPIRPAAEIGGGLTRAAAADLGLPAGTPVAIGGADTPVGLVGAGVLDPADCLLTLSTGGQLALPTARPDIDPEGRAHTFCTPLRGMAGATDWYRLAATLSAGAALEWLRVSVLGLAGDDAYAEMERAAVGVPPGSRGLVFLPYLTGERTPHMDPTARALFLGLTARHGRGELVRAVMEGVALAAYDASLVLGERSALPGSIILAGGGARSHVWRGIVADVFGLPVRVLDIPEQAAVGACIIAGHAAGILDAVTASRSWARYGAPAPVDAQRHARYLDLFDIYREAYVANRAGFVRLAAFDSTQPNGS